MTLLLWLSLAFAQDAAPDELPPLTEMPQLVESVDAVYPAQAEAEGIETSVLLDIDIDATGAVEAVQVVEASNAPGLGFEEAAVAAVRQYRFTPAKAGEEAVPVRISYRLHFALQAAEPPPEVPDPVVNLSGQVRERGQRTPLEGLKVTAFRGEEAYEARTDGEGRFEFFDLADGAWQIRVDGEGIRPFEDTEEIVAGQRTDVGLWVFRELTGEFDVLVEGERPRKEVTRHTLTAEQIRKVPGTFGDPLAVVQNLPGVSPQGFGDGTLIVRGASPEDTGLFLGGARVPLFYHFGSIRSVVPVDLIEDIQFYPGNAPLDYGRLTGGVLEVTPKIIEPDAVHGYADINVFDAAGLIQAPIGDNLAFAVGGRRSWIDTVLDVAIPEDSGFNLTAAPRFQDVQGVVAWRPNDAHELQLFYLGSGDQFVALFDNPRDIDPEFATTDFEARLSQKYLGLQHNWKLGENSRNELRISGIQAKQYFKAGPEHQLDIDERQLMVRNTLSAQMTEQIGVRLGGDAVLQRETYEVYLDTPVKEGEYFAWEQDALRYVKDTVDNSSGGAFGELTIEPVDGLSLIGGARTDAYQQLKQATVDPRTAIRARVLEPLTLKAGLGWYHQSPTRDELANKFGNPELGPEAARHVSAGFELQPNDWFTADVTGFHKALYDSVDRTERGIVQPDGSVKPLRYDNSGEGRVRGLEVLLKADQHRNFSGWIAYTLSKAERRDRFGGDRWRIFDWDRPHVLTAVGSYQLPKRWELSGRFRYMSGQPFTPVEDSVFVSDVDLYTPIIGPINSGRQPDIHLLDLRVGKQWDFRRWSLDTYIDVQNVYNNTKTGGTTYNYDYTEAEAADGLPIIPALGLRGEW